MTHALTTYRDENGLTLEAFAQKASATKSQVWKWENGTIPRPAQMQRIIEATGGKISPQAWYSEAVA